MTGKLNAITARIGLHSLRFKVFIICMVICNVMVFINASAITRQAAGIITDNAYGYIYESMRHADSNFDLFLEDALSLSISIVSNRDIVIEALLDESNPASYPAFELQKQAEDYLENLAANKSHILLAAVIGLDGRGYKSAGSLILRSVVEEPWFAQTSENSGVKLFYNTPSDKRIALCRPIRYNGRLLGVGLVEMDFEILDSVYSITPLQNAKIGTFSEDGSLVFANYDTAGDPVLSEAVLKELIDRYDEDQTFYTVNGVQMLAAKYTSSLSGLTTIGLVPYEDLLTEALSLQRQSVSVMLFSVAAATFAAWLFARYISRNIDRLQRSMLKISAGEMDARADIASRDEIGVMAGIFNGMMDRIASLMQNIKEKEEQKRKAEQDALETQIQPHFIYNTINSIAYVAHSRSEKEIEDVAIATVELLRGVMGVRESFVPVWHECEYIEQYLKVQRFRLKKNFTVLWDVQEELWPYKIPKLLLQPIVENALIHGISEMEDGQINVQITRAEDKVLIRVTDNGKGIPPNTLEELNDGKPGHSRLRTVGFPNVKSRVETIYGAGYGVWISSVHNAFTSVEITLPYTREES